MKKIKELFFLLSSACLLNTTFSQTSPYYHQIYSATSTDGLNWTKQNVLLFDHASVPGAVKDTNGTIFLYFDYFASTSSTEKLMVASSTDGITFTTAQEVQITGSTVIRRVDPTALLLPDGSIRLFYIDFDVSPNTKEVHSATSVDGIHFTEDLGIRFTKEPITDPDVFSIGDSVWVMYVTYWGNGMELIRSMATDGLTFIEDTTFFFDKGGVSGTMQYDTLFRTYYCGNGIESFTTTKGKGVTMETGSRIDGPVCDPTIIEFNQANYIMYYKYVNNSAGLEEATSQEMIRIYPNPLINYATLIIGDNAYTRAAQFTLYNLLGNSMVCTTITQTHTLFERNDLPAGIYLYTLSAENSPTLSGKLIIH